MGTATDWGIERASMPGAATGYQVVRLTDSARAGGYACHMYLNVTLPERATPYQPVRPIMFLIRSVSSGNYGGVPLGIPAGRYESATRRQSAGTIQAGRDQPNPLGDK